MSWRFGGGFPGTMAASLSMSVTVSGVYCNYLIRLYEYN